MNINLNDLGYNIKQLRELNNLTQLDLANILGVTQIAISNYENGKRLPEKEILFKLVDIFNISSIYELIYNNVDTFCYASYIRVLAIHIYNDYEHQYRENEAYWWDYKTETLLNWYEEAIYKLIDEIPKISISKKPFRNGCYRMTKYMYEMYKREKNKYKKENLEYDAADFFYDYHLSKYILPWEDHNKVLFFLQAKSGMKLSTMLYNI